MKKYGLVSQEDEWGCGAACVASLLGVSYRKAKKLVEIVKEAPIDEGQDRPGPGPGLELHHIAIALHDAGVKVIADWYPAEIPDGSIVCIGGDWPYDNDHYILKTPNGWMDPCYDLKKKNMVARYRKDYPEGTDFLVALVPVSASQFIG